MINFGPPPEDRRRRMAQAVLAAESGAAPATPEDIASRQRMAQSLIQEGSSGAPVGHWTQALNRGLQGLSGGMMQAQASSDATARAAYDEQQSTAKRMAERLATMDDKKHMTEWERSLPPTQGELLNQQYKQAQINKYNREATEAGMAYGKNGTTVMGPDGNYYVVRYGADGTERINPLQLPGSQHMGGQQPEQTPVNDGAGRFAAPGIGSVTQPPVQLTPSRGVGVTGDLMYSKETGAPIRNVGGNLAEAERQKSLGKGYAEGQLALPKSATALKQYQEQDKIVGENIDRAISQANGWTTGLTGAATSAIPGTAAHNLKNTLNTIKANLGFDKLQALRDASPTGGALGQVSEMENVLLQSVWGSVEQSQTQEQLVQNLNRIKAIRQQYATLKQQAYDQDVARFGAGAVPNPSAPGPETAPPQNPTPDAYKSKYGLD